MSERTYHIISPNGEVKTAEYEDVLEFGCIPFAQMREMLGFPEGTLLEHVNVLWRGKRAHMFVDEEGLLRNPPLPFNQAATRVYWNATMQREGRTEMIYDSFFENPNYLGRLEDPCDREDLAPIVGPALLWEGDLE